MAGGLIRPEPGSGASPESGTGLTVRVALAGLLVAVVLAGIAAAIPFTRWDNGIAHGHGLVVGLGLEIVLAILLIAAERHRRRVPAVGQPAAGLRVLLRAGLIGGLVAIPVLMLLNQAGKLKPRPRPTLTPPPPRRPTRHLSGPPLDHGVHIALTLVLYSLIALVLLAAIVACLILMRRLHRRGPRWADLGDLAEDETEEQLREAVRSGQAALHEIDDARLAIIACYVAMEHSLAGAGAARGAAETPDELLERAAGKGLVRGAEAARLTTLFYEARYSTHPVPDERRDEARRALQVLAGALSQRSDQAQADQAPAEEAR
jgi:hypothetical protein